MEDITIGNGDVLIAAITSCTNTSNPGVLLAAGLLAKKAVEAGLRVKPHIKTSLAPGSRIVTEYLTQAGLMPYLEKLGFALAGYGCTTCIGNSGDLTTEINEAITKSDLICAAVLSGNRNFEARIHPNIKANFLASPPLVVAYAIAGTVLRDLMTEPVGKGHGGKDVWLGDIWPTSDEIYKLMKFAMNGKAFRENYAKVKTEPGALWQDIHGVSGETYTWPKSTYIARAAVLPGLLAGAGCRRPAEVSVRNARIMALFGDSITTDHISPAGSIKESSPAGQWLLANGVKKPDFNSYGARRGNHEVMMRGTFANVRIKNLMIPAGPDGSREEGGVTLYRDDGGRAEKMFIYDAAMKYIGAGPAHGDLRRRGIRHRLVARLGRQGHAAAGHQGRDRQELRANPPQQPGGHGRAAAAVQGQRHLADAALDRRGADRRHPRPDAAAAKRRNAGGDASRRQPPGAHPDAAHRYAHRGGLLPQRRHPAVRIEAAAGGLSDGWAESSEQEFRRPPDAPTIRGQIHSTYAGIPAFYPVATTLLRNPSGAPDDLLLKVTPPRVPRNQVARPRLQADHEQLRDHSLILVQAPAGFGKTSLLAQWRREHLAQGRVVAWMSGQPQDGVPRFVQSLALAVRTGAGRPTFGHTLLEAVTPAGLEGVTVWLADVARLALDIVLFVDEADRLPESTRIALAYLLRNAPPNLRVVVAARADCQLGIDDLVAYGNCIIVGPSRLRFRLDETIELIRGRFGSKVDRDAAARLQDLTEGWPLGLQLALTVMTAGSDPQAEISTIVAQGGALRDQFVNVLLVNLNPADVMFLTRISILDMLHPQLCRIVVEEADAGERLARLARDTPVFSAGEASDWLRMHMLARDELRRRFALLPSDEQARLHARCAEGLASRGMVEAAARHAFAAGQHELAYDLAERSLYESLTRGGQDNVLDWLERLPAAELDRRPRLLLAAAWSLALSERHEQADHLIERLLNQPDADAALRCECALIQSGAALYADDPDRSAALHEPWAQNPPLRDPLLLQVHANRSALRTLLGGEPALARLRQQQAPRSDDSPAAGYLVLWGDFILGLSYLWEGQVLLAENLLRPTLARADNDIGRRSPFACMVAAVLAAATWERNEPDEAGALLANRLDVLERSGLAEMVLVGYQTMARIAGAEGAEHRALELLGAMDAVGVTRGLPRLRIASLSDQVRLHARRFRAETCRELCAQIDARLAEAEALHGRDLAPQRDAVARGGAGVLGHRSPGVAPCRRDPGACRCHGAGGKARPPAYRAAGPASLGAGPLR